MTDNRRKTIDKLREATGMSVFDAQDVVRLQDDYAAFRAARGGSLEDQVTYLMDRIGADLERRLDHSEKHIPEEFRAPRADDTDDEPGSGPS